MSAVAEMLIRDLAEKGIRLSRNADRLRIEAPPGAVSQELQNLLSQRKAELLAALSRDPSRARLLRLAEVETISADRVRELSAADVGACADLPDTVARAYLRTLRDSHLRAHKKTPSDETVAGLCKRCGPVWLAPEVAATAPVVDGWPRLHGCPWCFIAKPIPRPHIACVSCRHFAPDSVNPPAGVGQCRAGHTPTPSEPMFYPNALRSCDQFDPSSRSTEKR